MQTNHVKRRMNMTIKKHNSAPKSMEFNLISTDTTLKGEFHSEQDVRINGVFIGNISTKGKLIVGPVGSVDGTIVCKNAEIEGHVNASVDVEEMLAIKGTAKIIGDISMSRISIEPGAVISGKYTMNHSPQNL